MAVKQGGGRRRRGAQRPGKRRQGVRVETVRVKDLRALRSDLDSRRRSAGPPRWNADPEDVQRSVAKLVLTLVDFLRQLLERQAIRRVDEGTLTPAETESVGLALLRLEKAVRDLGRRFGLGPDDLRLDLGPLGRLT